MPIPDTNGLPPFANFEDMMRKVNELVQKYNNLLVNLDSLNVVSLTADHIDAGTIDASKVTVRADLNNGGYIQIDGTGMVVNNGTKDTLKIDFDGNITAQDSTWLAGVIIGSLIRTAGTYPRIELSSVGNLLTAYRDAMNFLAISPTAIGGTPTLYNVDNGIQKGSISMVEGDYTILSIGAANLNVGASQNLNLYAGFGKHVIFDSWSAVKNKTSGNTLQQDFNSKADAVSYSTTLSVIDSVDFVNQTTTSKTITITNGMITNVS